MRSKLPGSWFDGLVGAEKTAQYEAEAYETGYEFQTDPYCAL